MCLIHFNHPRLGEQVGFDLTPQENQLMRPDMSSKKRVVNAAFFMKIPMVQNDETWSTIGFWMILVYFQTNPHLSAGDAEIVTSTAQ